MMWRMLIEPIKLDQSNFDLVCLAANVEPEYPDVDDLVFNIWPDELELEDYGNFPHGLNETEMKRLYAHAESFQIGLNAIEHNKLVD